jgi:hypothetical protein
MQICEEAASRCGSQFFFLPPHRAYPRFVRRLLAPTGIAVDPCYQIAIYVLLFSSFSERHYAPCSARLRAALHSRLHRYRDQARYLTVRFDTNTHHTYVRLSRSPYSVWCQMTHTHTTRINVNTLFIFFFAQVERQQRQQTTAIDTHTHARAAASHTGL